MRALTDKEHRVLTYLRTHNKWISPTEVGQKVGGGLRHSSWGSPICLRLVKLGMVLRHSCGWYKAV